MGYYLLDHRNPNGDHFYTTRRGKILAIVVHITAGLEDLDGGSDHSAEATAQYAATTARSVSWHLGSDTDSGLHLLPDSYTAFHVVGYNSVTVGHEISKATADWRPMSKSWIDRTLSRAAALAAPVAKAHGIPARHATKAELDREVAKGAAGRPVGFIGHYQLDDARRNDPGQVGTIDTFPWSDYLGRVARIIDPTPEDDMPAQPFSLWQFSGAPEVYRVAADGQSAQHVTNVRRLNADLALLALGGHEAKVNVAIPLTAEQAKAKAKFPTSTAVLDFYGWLQDIIAAPGSTP